MACAPSQAHGLQEYIENENARLEREQQFWAKEIVVKIEYKYCPNLTIIDTPGEPHGTPCLIPARVVAGDMLAWTAACFLY